MKWNVLCLLLSLKQLYSNAEPCPNPAKHCLSEMFNVVFPSIGCLGCQGGCEAGYIMTSNPNVYQPSTDPFGFYTYNGLQISNTKNVSEPQWICKPGDSCYAGFYSSSIGGHPSCEWCGEGCSHCSSFSNCDRCFGGYETKLHVTHGTTTRNCIPGTVLCPNRTEHCTYKLFVSAGAGCLGCHDCESGYIVTFNPEYYSVHNGSYDYKGITIHSGRDVYQPRHICVKGTSCADGWYERHMGTASICEWCGDGCARCAARNACEVCKQGYNLKNNSHCEPDSHVIVG